MLTIVATSTEKTMNEVSPQVLDVVVVGAGLGGIYQLYRTLKDGLTCRAFEAADGIGGVWYWNRYPGARVDSHFPFYQYWFAKELWDEADWSERFPAQPEIERYLNRVVDKYDLRRHISFSSRVISAKFEEEAGTWEIRTDRGDVIKSRFVIFNTGGLSEPTVPSFPGYEKFAGPSYHTSRWPKENVELAGKRVCVFGTGATGIQVIQTIASCVSRLTVFQRTPQYAIAIRNPQIVSEDLNKMRRSYEDLREKVQVSRGGFVFDDGVPPKFEEVSEEQRDQRLEKLWNEGNLRLWGESFADTGVNADAAAYVSEFVRRKIRSRIANPKLAEKLIPRDYYFGSRRVPLENGYYEAFNRDNVDLVDLRLEPVVSIDETGINTAARHYDLDVIIYATGFDAGVGAIKQIDIRGLGGVALKDMWESNLRTTLGMQVHGFPNLFMTMAPFAPAAAICNVPVCVDQQCNWIADAIGFVQSKGRKSIQPSAATEAEWMAHHESVSEPTLIGQNRNSWYRRKGRDGSDRELLAYLGGIPAYRDACEKARLSNYQGFEFT
jgi:acetone monooxygenase (methyl acetate-forming)